MALNKDLFKVDVNIGPGGSDAFTLGMGLK